MSDAPPSVGDVVKDTDTRGGILSGEDIAHFEAIARFAHGAAGLVLSRDKAPMVLARVGKRMRALGLASLGDYHAHLQSESGEAERSELLFALTTNVTSFFRERHHFDALRDKLSSELARRARAGHRIRLWSAGCSTGQEAYTIAMVVLEALPDAPRYDIRVLATDIDRKVLAQARAGTYDARQTENVPEPLLDRYFTVMSRTPTDHFNSSEYRIKDALRHMVAFRELNLLKDWPMRKKFDAIFCRNVVIYFDRDTQSALWPKFAEALQPDGLLFLGHSERIDTSQFPQFRPAGTTFYQLDPAASSLARRTSEWH
jgi:chemotaxis protein methyltransferase CheR